MKSIFQIKHFISVFTVLTLNVSHLYSTYINFDQFELQRQDKGISFDMESLPNDIKIQIFSYLENTDLANTALVSQTWNKITRNQMCHLNANDFYNHYRSKTSYELNIPDNDLKVEPDIQKYSFDPYLDKNLDLLDEYVERCIRAEINGGHSSAFYSLSKSAVQCLLDDNRFIEYFKNCILISQKENFYDRLQTRAVNVSRSKPMPDYPNGEPQINLDVRRANLSYARQCMQAFDKEQNQYIEHVEMIRTTQNYNLKFEGLKVN